MNFEHLWKTWLYCFPYRSYEQGSWSNDWPWVAFQSKWVDMQKRDQAVYEKWLHRASHSSPGAV